MGTKTPRRGGSPPGAGAPRDAYIGTRAPCLGPVAGFPDFANTPRSMLSEIFICQRTSTTMEKRCKIDPTSDPGPWVGTRAGTFVSFLVPRIYERKVISHLTFPPPLHWHPRLSLTCLLPVSAVSARG